MLGLSKHQRRQERFALGLRVGDQGFVLGLTKYQRTQERFALGLRGGDQGFVLGLTKYQRTQERFALGLGVLVRVFVRVNETPAHMKNVVRVLLLEP